MRISDWSSDVCSSDLLELGLLALAVVLHSVPIARLVAMVVSQQAIDRQAGHTGFPRSDTRGRPRLGSLPGRLRDILLGRCVLLSVRSEEHTSELQSLMRISYAVFCLKKKKKNTHHI